MAVRKVQKKKTSNLQKTTSIKSRLADTFRDTDVNVCLFSTDGVYSLSIKESSRRNEWHEGDLKCTGSNFWTPFCITRKKWLSGKKETGNWDYRGVESGPHSLEMRMRSRVHSMVEWWSDKGRWSDQQTPFARNWDVSQNMRLSGLKLTYS